MTVALRKRVREVRKLTPWEQTDAHLRCLFLDENDRCAVYPVRPIRCIGVASTLRDACEAALARGQGTASLSVYGPVMACTQGVLSGATVAMRELGLDAGHYELNAAVLAALEAPEAAQRWLQGEHVLSSPPSAANPRVPPSRMRDRPAGTPHARAARERSTNSAVYAKAVMRESSLPDGSGRERPTMSRRPIYGPTAARRAPASGVASRLCPGSRPRSSRPRGGPGGAGCSRPSGTGPA